MSCSSVKKSVKSFLLRAIWNAFFLVWRGCWLSLSLSPLLSLCLDGQFFLLFPLFSCLPTFGVPPTSLRCLVRKIAIIREEEKRAGLPDVTNEPKDGSTRLKNSPDFYVLFFPHPQETRPLFTALKTLAVYSQAAHPGNPDRQQRAWTCRITSTKRQERDLLSLSLSVSSDEKIPRELSYKTVPISFSPLYCTCTLFLLGPLPCPSPPPPSPSPSFLFST